MCEYVCVVKVPVRPLEYGSRSMGHGTLRDGDRTLGKARGNVSSNDSVSNVSRRKKLAFTDDLQAHICGKYLIKTLGADPSKAVLKLRGAYKEGKWVYVDSHDPSDNDKTQCSTDLPAGEKIRFHRFISVSHPLSTKTPSLG